MSVNVEKENDAERLLGLAWVLLMHAVNVLKEWLISCGHEEDWMKHL